MLLYLAYSNLLFIILNFWFLLYNLQFIYTLYDLNFRQNLILIKSVP